MHSVDVWLSYIHNLLSFVCFGHCRSTPLINKDLTAQQQRKCPALAHIESKPAPPTTKKWTALDSEQVCAVGSVREEKTYSQAFAKKDHTPTKTGGQAKRERSITHKNSATSSEEVDASSITINNISLEGRSIDREVGGASRELHRKKSKKGDLYQTQSKNRITISSSLFGLHEGVGERRPSIERGGTNTIVMEVSGIGSWNSSESHPQQISQQLSQSTKESILHKKLKQETANDDFEVEEKKSHSAMCSNATKKSPQVLPVLRGDQVEGTSTFTTANCSVASAPVETTHKRNRKKRSSSESTPSQALSPHQQHGDMPPQNRSQSFSKQHTLTVTDMDLPFGGRNGSPQELDQALLESHVHANPDQAVKTALQSLANDDWSNKCEGIGMIICMSLYYPSLLQAQLHVILSAVQREV